MSHNDVGDEILLSHEVFNLDGELEDATTITLTVTLPDLTTAIIPNTRVATGEYEASYTLAQAGRYTFLWKSTDPDTAEAYAIEAVAPGTPPSLAVVKAYLGVDSGWTDAEINEALIAETAAQKKVCRIEAIYPADLAEALKRRVARNLALRAMPLAVLQGDAEGGNVVLPGRDPEVRRLEGPHRKVVLG